MNKETTGKSDKTGQAFIAGSGAQEELQVYFNAMDEVFFSVDMINKKVIQVSHACEKLYGYQQADFLADYLFWFELIHPDDKHIIVQEDKLLEQGEIVNNQYRIIRKDKSIRWVENKIIPKLDPAGKLVRVDGITRDITKNKLAEEKLKKSEANLRTVFENTDTAYVLFNSDCVIISFNALAQKYSQEQNQKSLETNRSIKDYFSAERWPVIQDILDRVAKGEQVEYELNLTDPNGTVKWFDVRWLNVRNNDNQNWGFILANKEITETKNATLERERITADLVQHNKDLEQFTYIISHNLRAPVANILGLSDMLNEHDLDLAAKMEVFDRVSQSIKNIDTVIKDLNQILQAREMVNEKKETIYFDEIIDAIEASIHNIVLNERAQFKYSFEEAESIFSIRSYLYSILYNLSSNSIKFRRPGIAPVITITSKRVQDKIELHFKDNGKGIDLDKHGHHLFGLYKRFDNSMEGKGMGLFMVKTQVEALGGTIKIKSTPSEGTEFVIQLPV